MDKDPAPHPSPTRVLWLWAVACVAWCVLLLLMGANVRTQRGGLSIPDWPYMYGELLPGWDRIRQMLGPDPLRAEFLHRLIAAVMGLLTIALATVVQMRDQRRWVRRLCWGAVALVIVQGVLGGVGVLTMLGPPWPLLHSVFAQVFFCLLVVIATVLSPWWQTREVRPLDASALPVMRGAVLATAALFVHLLLGAAARHGYLAREVHAMFAIVVAILLVKLTLAGYGDTPRDLKLLRRPAAVIGLLTVAQVALGMGSYFIAAGRDDRYILELSQIATLNAHLVLGALLLATTVTIALRAFRLYGLPTDERVAEARHRLEIAA